MNQALNQLDFLTVAEEEPQLQTVSFEPPMEYRRTLTLKMKPVCMEDTAGNYHIEMPRYNLEGYDNEFYMQLLRDPKSLEEVRNLLTPKDMEEPILEFVPMMEEAIPI